MMIYLMFFMLSVIIISQSNSIISLWISLELNTLLFLFLMKKEMETELKSEFFVKYYLIQSISSLIFIQLVISYKYPMIWIFFVIMFKAGMPPFHFWILNIMESMKFKTFFYFNILQKIPILVLFLFLKMHMMMLLIIIMLNLFALISAFVEIKFINLLFFSSLLLLFDFLVSVNLNFFFFAIWFVIYLALNIYFFLSSQVQLIFGAKMTESKNFIPFIFLILTSLPPFNFFFMKIFLMSYLFKLSFVLFFLYLLLTSIFVFIYSRIIVIMFLEKFFYMKIFVSSFSLMLTMFYFLFNMMI